MGARELYFGMVSTILIISCFNSVVGGCLPVQDDIDEIDNVALEAVPRALRSFQVAMPPEVGPYNVSYTEYNITNTGHSNTTHVKVYYPADTYEWNGTPNATGAPYPLVIMNPHYGGAWSGYVYEACVVASNGFVFMVTSPHWDDPTWLGVQDHNEIIDFMATQNSTPGALLQGIVYTDRVGLMGHSSGGGITAAAGPYITRVKAIVPWAGAIGSGSIDMIAPDVHTPYLIQIGEYDDMYAPASHHMYKDFNVEKEEVIIRDGGHGGPFRLDMSTAFFFVHLYQNTSYRECIFGNCAFDLLADGLVNLSFKTDDGKVWPPNASYAKVWPTQVFDDQPINFTGWVDGIFIPDHPRANFTWDFDSDGVIDYSDHQNNTTTYIYKKSGTYKPVFAWTVGIWSLVSQDVFYVRSDNVVPFAEAGPDISTSEDAETALNASGSWDTPSDIEAGLFFKWVFGDGAETEFLNTSTAIHIYTQKGKFAVKLTVKDIDGATSEDSLNVTVSNIAPTVHAVRGISGAMDSPVNLTGWGNDTPSDRAFLKYRWDFGDGDGTDWSDGPEINHTYMAPGAFTANLTVKDSDGDMGIDTSIVYIDNPPPGVSITAPDPNVTYLEDEEVTFDSFGSDTVSDLPKLEYMWDFGDGAVTVWSPIGIASHAFAISGDHTVTAFAKDSNGTIINTTIVVKVANASPSVAGHASSSTGSVTDKFFEEEVFNLTAEGHDTPSDEGGLTFSWALIRNDGVNEELLPFAEGRNASYSFPQKGVYPIRLIVTDDDGAQSDETINITIMNRPPIASGGLDRTEVFVSEEFNFSASATDTAADMALGFDYFWDFGNGNIVYSQKGIQTYWDPGTYNVTLIVTDDDGDTDTKIFVIVVKPTDGGGGGGTDDGGDMQTNVMDLGPVYVGVIAGIILMTLVIITILIKTKPGKEEDEETREDEEMGGKSEEEEEDESEGEEEEEEDEEMEDLVEDEEER